MTSFAFIFGVTPLVWAIGAGAELRQALGTAVFFGMIGVTAFGLDLHAGVLCHRALDRAAWSAARQEARAEPASRGVGGARGIDANSSSLSGRATTTKAVAGVSKDYAY